MGKSKQAKAKKETKVEKPIVKKVEQKVEKKTVSPEVKETEKEDKKETKKVMPKDKTPILKAEEVSQEEKAKRAIAIAQNAMGGIPTGSTSTASANSEAMLAHVMWEKYGKNEELAKNYPELFNDLNRATDVVVLLGLVKVREELLARNEAGKLQLVVNADQVMPLQNMANMLGIELAPAKELPNKQLEIDFIESKVPEELKEQQPAQEEKVVVVNDNMIEHPENVKELDEIIAVLNHLLKSNKNVAHGIAETVEWYRKNRISSEENANKKIELDDRSVYSWIEEIFNLIKPTAILQGLGRAIYLYTKNTNGPIMSHAVLHKYLKDHAWNEEQIANTQKALLLANFRYNLKDEKSPKNEKDDKALKSLLEGTTVEYVNSIINPEEGNDEAKQCSKMVLGAVRDSYFPNEKQVHIDKIRMKIGQIANVYRDPIDRIEEFLQEESSTSKVEKTPKDEKKS